MPYPNVEGKHNSFAIYSPADSLAYRRSLERGNLSSPEGVIITYQSSMVDYLLSLEDGLRHHFVTNDLYYFSGRGGKENEVGIYFCGFGASHAVVIMENLIARGAKKVINIGVAGSLQENIKIGDVVVCNKAIRDEGVSYHYLEADKYVDLSSDLTKKLKGGLSKMGLSFRVGTTWTIDAPFQETEEERKQYQSEGVLTVEMETSALAAVAKRRNVEFAAAFVIGDLLKKDLWVPGFHSEQMIKQLEKLHEAALWSLSLTSMQNATYNSA